MNDQELGNVSGGVISAAENPSGKINYCITDAAGAVVASYTSEEEAKEAFDRYGTGYRIVTKII